MEVRHQSLCWRETVGKCRSGGHCVASEDRGVEEVGPHQGVRMSMKPGVCVKHFRKIEKTQRRTMDALIAASETPAEVVIGVSIGVCVSFFC